jgi:hypothetical protein
VLSATAIQCVVRVVWCVACRPGLLAADTSPPALNGPCRLVRVSQSVSQSVSQAEPVHDTDAGSRSPTCRLLRRGGTCRCPCATPQLVRCSKNDDVPPASAGHDAGSGARTRHLALVGVEGEGVMLGSGHVVVSGSAWLHHRASSRAMDVGGTVAASRIGMVRSCARQ